MKAPKAKSDLEAELSSAISSSWKATSQAVGPRKEKTSSSFASNKSSSVGKTTKPQLGHGQPHSGLSDPVWKDPGTAALAPAILVSVVVSPDGQQSGFSQQSATDQKDSLSESSSMTAAIVRPSSYFNGFTRLMKDAFSASSSPPNGSDSMKDNSSNTNPSNHPLSLFTQIAPSRSLKTPPPSNCSDPRVSPPQQVSQLSAHTHLHKPHLRPDKRRMTSQGLHGWSNITLSLSQYGYSTFFTPPPTDPHRDVVHGRS